jgi:RNA polymerase subunit RPABC4/transcription elongation factor Spt4
MFGGLFGGGAKKEAAGAAPQLSICVDCGYLTDDYKRGMVCPVCKSKNFKNFKGAAKRIDNSPKQMQARMKARQW